MQQIDLEPGEFRPAYKHPLAKPKDLWFGVIVFGAGALLGAFAAFHLNQWWAVLLPIPCAVWAGVSLAGLFPAWFFGKPD